jgi:hypothetical protein
MHTPLHIVAPDARRDKVFREIARPRWFGEGRPFTERCTFFSYTSIDALGKLENLEFMTDRVLRRFEEKWGFA